jgi:molecular chaperone HscB
MDLQKQVHPDRFANASDKEKRLSMQQTSWINEAQATLKDPVLRATYLLKLKGVDINLENETTMDSGFLMQQLEMRERLENISSEAEPLDALDALAKKTRGDMDAVMQGFAGSYEADQLDESREWVRKLQFMQKAIKEINSLTAKIEDELMG